MDYIFSFFKEEVAEVGLESARWERSVVLLGLTAVLTYLNWRGALLAFGLMVKPDMRLAAGCGKDGKTALLDSITRCLFHHANHGQAWTWWATPSRQSAS